MHPVLSVVVPIYNAEPYVEECLTSLAQQEYSNLDIVLVNDGSFDKSARIAREFVVADARFRLVDQPHSGPGAARNTGIRHIAVGSKYLAFADCDDIIPRDAYSRMVDSLEVSGSDLVTGNVFRLDSLGSHQFSKFAEVFKCTKIRTSIRETPGLVIDRLVWNKVYRREFWDRHRLSFPEGMLYEDSPITIPLHYLATTVDVIAETIYYWRIRDCGAPSITQQRTVQAMLDRFTSIDIIRAFLERDGRFAPECRISYDRNVLSEELPLFFFELIDADDRHRHVFVEKAAALLAEIRADLIAELPQPLQDRYCAIRGGRVRDFIDSLPLSE